MRADLTAEEAKRRAAVSAKIVELKPNWSGQLAGAWPKFGKHCAKALYESEVLLTISSNYFAWCVETNFWEMICKFLASELKAFRSYCHVNVADLLRIVNPKRDDVNAPKFPFGMPEKYGSPYSEIYLEVYTTMHLASAATSAQQLNNFEELQIPAQSSLYLDERRKLWQSIFPDDKPDGEPFALTLPTLATFEKFVASNRDELAKVMTSV